MRNTFITYVPSTKEFKKEELVKNMILLDAKNTVGFTTPDFSLFFECEENKHYYNLPLFERNFSLDEATDEVLPAVDKLVLVVCHKGLFTKLVDSKEFIEDLYTAIEDHVFVEKDEYAIDVMLSANV